MRIWDLHPGYLNRESLLGEHRELHGIVSIIVNGRKGYARHPETLRWVGRGWALRMRHRQLSCEMALRGFREQSPVRTRSAPGKWPNTWIDSPEQQFRLLREKYADRKPGRIPLPRNTQQLWSHHKYSVLARDPGLYREIGASVASNGTGFGELACLLTASLRERPGEGGIRNAVQHMWGYVSDAGFVDRSDTGFWSTRRLLQETQRRALANKVSYLMSSTALSELRVWLPDR